MLHAPRARHGADPAAPSAHRSSPAGAELARNRRRTASFPTVDASCRCANTSSACISGLGQPAAGARPAQRQARARRRRHDHAVRRAQALPACRRERRRPPEARAGVPPAGRRRRICARSRALRAAGEFRHARPRTRDDRQAAPRRAGARRTGLPNAGRIAGGRARRPPAAPLLHRDGPSAGARPTCRRASCSACSTTSTPTCATT